MNASHTFKGAALSPGKTYAQVCMYSSQLHKAVTEYSLNSDAEIDIELARFNATLKVVAADLETASRDVAEKIGRAEAEIFLAQKHIMLDPGILDKVKARIRSHRRNAEFVVSEVYKEFEAGFEAMKDEYLKERARDIADIRRRLLDHLKEVAPGFVCKGQQHCNRGGGRIIITEELTPNMIVNTDFTKVKGFVTEHGGSTSHAAIIARALGIPAVSGVHGIMDVVNCGNHALVDGDTGMVHLLPDSELVQQLMPKVTVHSEQTGVLKTPKGLDVMANASIPEEISIIREMEADGIGLFRTEFLFIKAGHALSEEEQYGIYSDIAEKMKGKPVTFRLLDVGGDKPLPFLHMETEANPYLGWRGSRFLLGRDDLLLPQLKALGRAAQNANIRILFPMVVDLMQWRKLKTKALETIDTAGTSKPLIGAMFEVPSAYFQAEAILKEADFASVGSNDLIQYLFAVDRNNEHVTQDYNPDHEVLWQVLGGLGAAAKNVGKSISICGEMASMPGMAHRLVNAGIHQLSVSPRFIPAVRRELAEGSTLA